MRWTGSTACPTCPPTPADTDMDRWTCPSLTLGQVDMDISSDVIGHVSNLSMSNMSGHADMPDSSEPWARGERLTDGDAEVDAAAACWRRATTGSRW